MYHDDLEVTEVILTLLSVSPFFCRGDLQHDDGLQLHDNAHVGPQRLGNGHEQPGDASHWNDWTATHARYHAANQRATDP